MNSFPPPDRAPHPGPAPTAFARARPGVLPGVLLIALPIILLAGCGSPAPPVRDVFFRLEPVVPTASLPAARPLPGTLLVMPFGSRGFLGGSQIVFIDGREPARANRYDDLLWEEPPVRALAGDLVTALRSAGLFEFVVTGAERARADWLLGGELTRLEHLPLASPPAVAVAFSLTMVGGRDRTVRFSASYTGDEFVGADTPDAMAAAFNRLTGRLLQDALADLAVATASLPER